MNKIPLIAIGGPTASGKTGLSIELAKRYDAEIVSCDSMQIYKGMDIGTAKPTEEEKEGIPHHMIDIVSPKVDYSCYDYVQKAHKEIFDIHSRGKKVIVIGGTGLYMNSLINDVDFCENDSDEEIRQELQEYYEKNGVDKLYSILEEIDPEACQKIHKNNVRRVIRAIEFYRITGVKISYHQELTKQKISRYEPTMLAIKWDMQKLYERIEKRVDIMLEQGLLDEVKNLMANGCTPDMLSMHGIGYKEFCEFIYGNCSYDEAVYNIKQGTRHYAKRQMTWFRKDERINWIDYDLDILAEAIKIIENKR